MIIDKTETEKDYFELIKSGEAELADGYYIEGGKLFYNKYDLKVVKKIIWDKNSNKWIETATTEEKDSYYFDEDVIFYNKELEFATKAVAELKCDIISPEDFEGVKLYMSSIDPHKKQKTRSLLKVDRPEVFKRYL